MNPRALLAAAAIVCFSISPTVVAPPPSNAAGEYAKHFAALSQLSVAVAQAMPADQCGFRPHPESMDFGQLMSHIAVTNYQFCASFENSAPPALPVPTEKNAIVRFLGDSFEYCSSIISNLTEEQLKDKHNSPMGVFPAAKFLPAMYIHVAHHRGQSRNLPPRQRHPPPTESEGCTG